MERVNSYNPRARTGRVGAVEEVYTAVAPASASRVAVGVVNNSEG